MKLIGASIILTCDDKCKIIKNGGILFDERRILKIGDYDELKKHRTEESEFYDSCVIVPAFINPHIHFEFSDNAATLRYGGFGTWLDSVMENREILMKNAPSAINAAIAESLRSGVACVGAISSNGLDLEALSQSPLKVMFFSEIMGTNPKYFEKIIDDFNVRLKKSLLLENANFKAGIALHSPYSLDFELASYAINRALEHKLLVSAHYLESKEELSWLESKSGYFKEFFKKFFDNDAAEPLYTKESFLELLENCESLLVHCLYLSNDDFERISRLNTQIVSCPRSNRLLNNRYFDFFKANDFGIPFVIATDGKSSNNSLSMLDEARAAIFAYNRYNVKNLAREILLAMTRNVAKKLRFNNGVIAKNKASDFAIFHIKDIAKSAQIELDFLLQAREVKDLYINGKRINFEKI